MSTEEFICPSCEKTFSNEKFMNKHITSQTCTKKHNCSKCGKEFSSAYNLRAHLKKKTPCVPDTVPVIDLTKNEHKCQFCGGLYSTKYSLKRHLGSCNMQNNQAAMMKLVLEQNKILMEQNQLLLLRNESPTTVNNNNNTVNVQQNIYMDVTFCNFGSEDFRKLNKDKIMTLLSGQVKDFMSKMIEYMHTDPDHPEFHNILYDSKIKMAIVLVRISDTEFSWRVRDFREMSEMMTDRIREHIAPGNGPYFDLAMKVRDYDTSNNIINIARHIDWKTPEQVAMYQKSLSKLENDTNFRKHVKVEELTE